MIAALLGILSGIATTALVTTVCLRLRLERERAARQDAERDADKWRQRTADAKEETAILRRQLTEERLRSESLLRVNYELVQANAELQNRLQKIYRLPLWSERIVWN
jgi:hypothetical protein